MLNLTIYEDTDPDDLSEKVGSMYGLNAGQQAKLSQTIEREMVRVARLIEVSLPVLICQPDTGGANEVTHHCRYDRIRTL